MYKRRCGWGRREACIGSWWGNLRERNHWGDPGADGRIILGSKEEATLLIFERKIFRRIYGPKNENGEWKIRTNRELEEISKGEKIVK
jgi:hypothetical protein